MSSFSSPILEPSVAELCHFFEGLGGVRSAPGGIDASAVEVVREDHKNAIHNDPKLVASATIVTASAETDKDAPDVVGTVITSVANSASVVLSADNANRFAVDATIVSNDATAPVATPHASNFTRAATATIGAISEGSPKYLVIPSYGIPASCLQRHRVKRSGTASRGVSIGPMRGAVIAEVYPGNGSISIIPRPQNFYVSVNKLSSTYDYFLEGVAMQEQYCSKTRKRSSSGCSLLCCWRHARNDDDDEKEGNFRRRKVTLGITSL